MFARIIKVLSAIFLILTIVFAVINQYVHNDVLLSIAITFGVTSYHFIMRLAVGYIINGIFHNKFNYNNNWFLEKKFEKKLYKLLKVKKWKDKMPTFAPEMLSLELHTWEEIAGAMCQSEIVHLIIAILSFVPILATFILESFWVFFITSVLSACVDLMFVIMQRYNRPRIVRMINRRKR